MKWIGTQVIYNDIRLNKSIYAGAQGLGDINIYARNVNILNDEVDKINSIHKNIHESNVELKQEVKNLIFLPLIFL